MIIRDKEEKVAASVVAYENSNMVSVYDKSENPDKAENLGLAFGADEDSNSIYIKGKVGEEGLAFGAYEKSAVGITIYDRAGTPKWIAP